MNIFGNNKPEQQPQPRRRRQRKNKWLAKAALTLEPTLDKMVQTNPLLQAAVLSKATGIAIEQKYILSTEKALFT